MQVTHFKPMQFRLGDGVLVLTGVASGRFGQVEDLLPDGQIRVLTSLGRLVFARANSLALTSRERSS
ncbi:MAG: hypothetical protein HUU16_00055 [Candidatus Omnitrophica bacterium]|nr:hypothetical protein [bacterium]NUN94541.1 hypothetical protein [Candidatus Omnitrophota bacterium]